MVMWLLTALSVSVVLGTVLLSNDMQHLKSLMHRFGIELIAPPPTAPPQPARTYRPKLSDITLPPSLFSDGRTERPAEFFWVRQIYGPALCERLRANGIPVSEWVETAFHAETMECVYEQHDHEESGNPRSSRFLVVRGDRSGNVTGIRIKLVSPPRDDTGRLDRTVMRMFETVLDEPHWPDFDAARAALLTLDDYRTEGAGIAFLFSQEPSRPGSYNMTLSLTTRVPPTRRPYASPRSLNRDEAELPPPVREDGITRFPFLNGWIPRPCASNKASSHHCVNPAPRPAAG